MRLREFSVAPVAAGESGTDVCARGKFLYLGSEKLYVRGVTYGTFRPDDAGSDFDRAQVDGDFAAMAEAGFNAVRTYTVPPSWLLDRASDEGLRVLVGLPWEQHVAFLEGRRRRTSIAERVRDGVRSCAGHPAVLAYAVGNEIPASVVRWHGRQPVERHIERLYDAAKSEDPDALVTYVNFPSTEYLQLPFLDFVAFNVYLESPDAFGAYLARLQNVAGERPLLMAELGLDSRRNGLDRQAAVVDWQLRASFTGGCAGAFVYSWTDEWHRGGHEILDWDFGLTDRTRRPKPALSAASMALEQLPIVRDEWPRVSVVVCSHDGAATIGDCLRGLQTLAYPRYEVIVVDDGSSDGTGDIAGAAGARVVRTANRGLASARNRGLEESRGDVVAYLDDDAVPDPHWLTYAVDALLSSAHAAVGGPNLAPPDGVVADAVANAPGGPNHVLVSDTVAEHIPGCNMVFWRDGLASIGAFDPQFIAAGDDVDVCWRVQARGWTIGFAPAAVVWHRRRGTVRGYLRQQRGYGKAEALLERKWPEKYNLVGHATWAGRLYGSGARDGLRRRWRVYYGTWGLGGFQRVYRPPPVQLAWLPLMPEWMLVLAALAAVSLLGLLVTPFLLAVPAFVLATGAMVVESVLAARRSPFRPTLSRRELAKRRTLTAVLHVLQPVARLAGRFDHGLTPWRLRRSAGLALPAPRVRTVWSEHWLVPEGRLAIAEEALRADGELVAVGGDFDRWDIHVSGTAFGSARLLAAVEEHGAGRQLLRYRLWPRVTVPVLVGLALAVLGAVAAATEGQTILSLLLAAVASLVGVQAVLGASAAMAALERAVTRQHDLARYDLAADLARRATAAALADERA